MESRPKQYAPEAKARAVAYISDRLDRYKSVYSTCQDLAPKLSIGAEIRAFKTKVKDLEESNEILCQSAIFFAKELDPRRP